MECINTTKGGEKICNSGYTFVFKHLGNRNNTWRYMKASSLNCKGTMYTDLQNKNPEEKNPHNHTRDEEEIKVTKCILEMMNGAFTSSRIDPVEIFAEGVSKTGNKTKDRMPIENTVKTMLRNQRSKDNSNSTSIEGKEEINTNF